MENKNLSNAAKDDNKQVRMTMKNEMEVMRVWRVPPMGKLVVEFRGSRFETIEEVPEENVRQLILTAVGYCR